MFITDQLTPAEMLSELLSIKGYSKEDTSDFMELRHDNDLCPQFRERASSMLDAYASYRTDVHDIQGMRDEGVDVLLKYNDGSPRRIGLQLKSYDEIEKWAKGKDKGFMKSLKSQHGNGIHNLKVGEYYLILCTDEIKHKKQIRSICSEMKQYEPLTIILPRQALAFYNMHETEIRAFVTRLLCEHDKVLESAQNTISKMPIDLAYLSLQIVCRAFEGDAKISQEELYDLLQDCVGMRPENETDENRLENLLWEIDGAGLSMTDADADYTIIISDLPTPLCAIYFDQKLRYGANIFENLTALLNITSAK